MILSSKFFLILIQLVVLIFSFLTCRFFFPLKKYFRSHSTLCLIFLCCVFAILVSLIPDESFPYICFAMIFFQLITCFPFFEGRLLTKVNLIFLFYLMLIAIESFFMLIISVADILFPDNTLESTMLFLNYDFKTLSLYTSVYVFCLYFFYKKLLPKLRYYYGFVPESSVLKLILPIICMYNLSNILFAQIDSDKPSTLLIHVGISLILLLFFFFYISKTCRIFEEAEQRKQSLLLQRQKSKSQSEYTRTLEQKYRAIRRWEHDSSNHLTTMTYLAKDGHWDEVSAYLEELMKQKEAD